MKLVLKNYVLMKSRNMTFEILAYFKCILFGQSKGIEWRLKLERRVMESTELRFFFF